VVVCYRKTFTTPSELRIYRGILSQGFEANPGLELANAFSVESESHVLVIDSPVNPRKIVFLPVTLKSGEIRVSK
jgi:hypothetical protein